jgi:uncharacterized protein (DUF1800 family)
MVDRLYARAGFGASDAERATWTGRQTADLIDFFLTSPQQLDGTLPPPLVTSGSGTQPIDPTASIDELVMEWLYQMQRAANPLIERLTLFLHRHWAVSELTGGIGYQFLLAYRDRLRRFADLPSNPSSSFRELALEMTTQDTAMSLFLNMWQNVARSPNENYAREFMELFCLGVRDLNGNPNYTQADVTQLARAFTGWRMDMSPSSPTFGQIAFGGSSWFDSGTKTILGETGNFGADPTKGSGTLSAVDLILSQPAHAPHIVTKLWSEFIVTPIPSATLASLTSAYVAGGQYLLAPLVRGILSHPLIFESLDEPTMVKPPIMYWVGACRALRTPLIDYWARQDLQRMLQCPYQPPNVAGWEGGLSWLTTNAAAARFDAVLGMLHLTYNGAAYPGSQPLADVPGETPGQAFSRAYQIAGSPWMSAGTTAQLGSFAASLPKANADDRAKRIYALIAMIIAGPDSQVM